MPLKKTQFRNVKPFPNPIPADHVRRDYRVRIYGTCQGQQTVNTMYFAMTVPTALAAADGDRIDDLLDLLQLGFIPALQALMSDSVTLNELQGELIAFPGPGITRLELRSDGLSVAGTQVGDPLPSFAAMLTNVRYEAHDSKIRTKKLYIPGIPESATEGSFLVDAQLALLGDLLDAIPDGAQVGIGQPDYKAYQQVLRIFGPNPDPDLVTYVLADATEMYGTNLIATMRLRKFGRGS